MMGLTILEAGTDPHAPHDDASPPPLTLAVGVGANKDGFTSSSLWPSLVSSLPSLPPEPLSPPLVPLSSPRVSP